MSVRAQNENYRVSATTPRSLSLSGVVAAAMLGERHGSMYCGGYTLAFLHFRPNLWSKLP